MSQVGSAATSNGEQVVAAFDAQFFIKTDAVNGPEYDADDHLTWQGSTQVKIDVLWDNVTANEWSVLRFMVSTKVHCDFKLLAQTVSNMCLATAPT